MIDRVTVQNCTLCRACSDICSSKAITYTRESFDFSYPEINIDKCINCNACESVCPVLNPVKRDKEPLVLGYAAKHKDEQIRLHSTSGGVFTAAAEKVLSNGGYVCGAIMDETFHVRHIVTNSMNDVLSMRGSKYVQSNPEGCYHKIRDLLKQNKQVLFFGCPCQVAALYSFLGGDDESLLSAELVCHGVPGDKMLQSYVRLLEKKYRSKVSELKFRDKSRGWHSSYVRVIFLSGKVYSVPYTIDAYTSGFLNNITLKESCYTCAFKNFSSASDLTIGDLWGSEIYAKDIDDNNGLSGVIVGTDRGWRFLESLADRLDIRPCSSEMIIKYNRNILEPSKIGDKRDHFYSYADTHGMESAICDLLWEKAITRLVRLVKGKFRNLYRMVTGKGKALY